ncbi:GvpL/GvpF family gas vesicle protein [Streptomyces triticiradicis]|uniref:GvpL/GvpF family gas vesicle protein n=1 Tax=Streptomyces triticiradicis TaxID=2651189 RepID=A0A7J5D9X7_9ACTN|nr:GvpL/GvpF family gas vesicle protein [Streptomyces triticiradicis]KAB1981427.1 GvpL/GvpF family gas vesicle protein [Streptomyces triticiradicis]
MSALRYVYAICRPFSAALSAELTGVGGIPPRLLRHGDLVAVVGSVPEREFAAEPLRRRLEDVHWLEATVRAHQGVIDALTAVTSPLPLRLATVLRDDSGVRVMMDERREDFLRTLDRFDGRVEWDVRVYAAPAGDSGDSADEFTSRLHDTLSECAEENRLLTPRNPRSARDAPPGGEGEKIFDAAYLVPRADSGEFVERVNGKVGEEPGVRVELTGPWAAYSFTRSTGLTGFSGLTSCTGC